MPASSGRLVLEQRPLPDLNAEIRSGRRILRMVQELHLRGYQRVRIAPSLSPSGTSWRCDIAVASNIDPTHGARLLEWDCAAHYSSSTGNRCFDWTDADRVSPSRLADLFVERFPRLAEAGAGSDWAYAGWYVEMLYITYPVALPIASADYQLPTDHLPCIGGSETRIPLPPLIPFNARSHSSKTAKTIAGADGCRSGWLCILEVPHSDDLEARIFPTFADMVSAEPRTDIIAVDISIGLPERGARACDIAARRRLGPKRGASVFSAPIRPVLEATDYKNASSLRRNIEGLGITQQAYGILSKIREVDTLLSANPALQTRIREVHPEVSFAEWAGSPIEASKRTAEGRAERKAMIESVWPGARQRLAAKLGRGGWQADDLNDAFAALWTARRIGNDTAITHPLEPIVDAVGLRMEIVA
jgi:predicted RNase H-like nuclease